MTMKRWQRLNIKNYKSLVYISTQYTKNVTQERNRACKLIEFVKNKGGIPIHPLVIFQYPETNLSIEDIKNSRKVLLAKCDEIYVFDDKNTEDTQAEIKAAIKQHRPVKKFSISKVIDTLSPL